MGGGRRKGRLGGGVGGCRGALRGAGELFWVDLWIELYKDLICILEVEGSSMMLYKETLLIRDSVALRGGATSSSSCVDGGVLTVERKLGRGRRWWSGSWEGSGEGDGREREGGDRG